MTSGAGRPSEDTTPRHAVSSAIAVTQPGLAASALRVFEFTLGEMLWSRRTVFMALVVGGPVVVAAVLRALQVLDRLPVEATIEGQTIRGTGPDVFGLMVWVFYVRFTVPVLGVFYGTSLVADEVEGKTITYLFTRPIARGAVLVGKYLAYLVCTGTVVLPSVVVVYFIVVPGSAGGVGAGFPTLVIDLGLVALGLAVYGAVFALVGAWFKYPLVTGLVFVFGWEPVSVVVPGYLKSLSVAYYLQGLVPHAMPQDGALNVLRSVMLTFQSPTPVAWNLAWLAVIWGVSLLMAAWVVGHREYVLDQ